MNKLFVRILVASIALAGLAGCFGFSRGHGPVDAFQFLTSRNAGLDQSVTGVMNEQADPVEILVVVPPSAGSLNLVATFSLNTEAAITVVSSGRPVPQQNGVTRNDFSAPVLYNLQVPGEKKPWRYRVTVRYAETNAALSQIGFPEGYTMAPLFSPRVKSYTVDVPYSARQVRIEAKGQSQNMKSISIDGAGSGGASARATVDFSSGASRRVSIETLAEDGVTREEYVVTLRRLPADSNARLESLDIVDAALVPAFSPLRTSYQAEVPFDTTQVVVKAKAQSRNATITLQTLAVIGRITSGRTALASRGSPTDRAGAVIDFSNGALLPLVVAVTAEDGGVQEYLVEVKRAEPDHNNSLAELAVAGGTMSPAFSSRVARYAVEVPFSTRQLLITARAQSAYATMELVQGPTTVGSVVPQLQARGDLAARGVTVEFPAAERMVLAVAVTAQDGRTQQYVLDVRRAPPDPNADLGTLSVSAGVLSPIFSPRIISYAVSLPASVESVRITATAASDVATVEVEGGTARPAATQTFTVSVAGGATETVNLIVTAEVGTQKLYRLRVSREATGPGGGDATTRLERLQLAGAQLDPAFDPRVFEYEAVLPASVPSVTLTAAAESLYATIEVDGQPLSRSGRVISLDPGTSKTVVLEVTAANGSVARTTLWLSRERGGTGRDTNTRLARLQLAGAQLNPGFDPLVVDYEARLASNVPSVTLTAVTESPTATIEVDGRPLERTGRVISLEPGSERMVVIDVTAERGNMTTTVLWLSRERSGSGRDTNTRLANLQLMGAELAPSFDPRVLEYQARLASNVDSVILYAVTESPVAAIEVDGQPLARTGRVIALDPGASRTVALDVRAESGNVARTLIRLSREVAKDTNARLSRLQLVGAEIDPDFDPRITEYQARMPANVDAVTLTALAESARAAIEVDGQPLARTGRVIAIAQGASRTVVVVVTAENGNESRTLIRLSREAAKDTNARLSRLQLVGAELDPDFDPRITEYQARMPANVEAVTLTALAESPRATIEVDGQPLARTGRVIALNPGASRTIVVDVRAESGNVARTLIRLSREAAKDTNARLSRLQLVGAEIDPDFDPRITEYQARMPANVDAVTLTALAESSRATIEVDGQPLARTGRVIALNPGASRTVVVDVRAESGTVARTLIRLSREAAKDTNARLSRLQLVGAELDPDFDPRITEYQARMPANVDAVTLTALAESPRATIEVDGQPLARTGRVIALNPGASRTIVVDVRAESGNVARTLIRLSREVAKDTNARLSRLQLVGALLNPDFDPRITEYQARMPANVDAVTLTALAESPRAAIEVDGQPLARTGRVIALNPGASRTIVVDVRAESGNVARTLIRLSREVGTIPPVEPPGGGDRVSVDLNGVKVARRELASLPAGGASIGKEARITVRSYRTTRTLVQETVGITVKMEGATPVISGRWVTSAVKLDPDRLVEVEVAIQAGGSAWLYYTEAQWATTSVEIDVPFLLLSRDLRVAWPALGRNVSVVGYVSLPRGGPSREGPQGEAEGLQLDARGEYGIEVTIADASSGKVLGRDTVRARPGNPFGRLVNFSRPMSLPEGATIRYTLTAAARNGKGWTATGTTQVWTTKPAYEGGFEPVVLQFSQILAPPR